MNMDHQDVGMQAGVAQDPSAQGTPHQYSEFVFKHKRYHSASKKVTPAHHLMKYLCCPINTQGLFSSISCRPIFYPAVPVPFSIRLPAWKCCLHRQVFSGFPIQTKLIVYSSPPTSPPYFATLLFLSPPLSHLFSPFIKHFHPHVQKSAINTTFRRP